MTRLPNKIIKQQWYCLPTGLVDGREWTIFARQFRIEQTPSGNYLLKIDKPVFFFKRKGLVSEWLKKNRVRILPKKADGDLSYIPKAFRYKKLGNYLDPRLIPTPVNSEAEKEVE
jgi:hypothetical protein